jgi:hypothetical protein
MRPHKATLSEAIEFIRECDDLSINKLLREIHKSKGANCIQQSLFRVSEDILIDNPKHQYGLVLHTLIFPPVELSIGYWMMQYKTHKFSTRLGELEKKLNKTLVTREWVKFTNRFGHSSEYRIYIPALEKSEYIELYKIINR